MSRTIPSQWNWRIVVSLSILVLIGVLAALWRESRNRVSTATAARVERDVLPNELRQNIVKSVALESRDALLDNLLNGYEDVAYAITGAGLDLGARSGNYRYARAVVPNLTRLRRILSEYPPGGQARPLAKLREMLARAIDDYGVVYAAYDQRSFELSKLEDKPAAFPERDAAYRCQLNAHVAVYLLAEFDDHEALPVLARAFAKQGRVPVSRLFVFYAMHLLMKSHPTDHLPARALVAHKKYLDATMGIPDSLVVEVPAWNARVDETDLRATVLRKDIGLATQLKIRIRRYPAALERHENFAPPAASKEMFPDGVSREVHGDIALIEAFLVAR